MSETTNNEMTWEISRSSEQLKSFISGKLANEALRDVSLD